MFSILMARIVLNNIIYGCKNFKIGIGIYSIFTTHHIMKNTIVENDQIAYAAFLRGINVGGNTLIKMEDLRKAFESYGYHNVKTLLASGNVLFEAPREKTMDLSQKITMKLRETFGREILVIVCSMADLRELETRQPFKDIEVAAHARSFITFISGNIKNRDISSQSMHEGFQILNVSDGMVCSVLYEQPGTGTVELMSAIEKEFGKNVTTRSWNTIIRLLKISNK